MTDLITRIEQADGPKEWVHQNDPMPEDSERNQQALDDFETKVALLAAILRAERNEP